MAVPTVQPLDDPGHLVEVAALQPLHIFPVAVIPVAGHLRIQGGESRQQLLRRLGIHHIPESDGLAGGNGDLQHKSPHGHLKDIVLLYRPADLLPYDPIDDAGAMHGMHHLVPYPEHIPPAFLLAHFSFTTRCM